MDVGIWAAYALPGDGVEADVAGGSHRDATRAHLVEHAEGVEHRQRHAIGRELSEPGEPGLVFELKRPRERSQVVDAVLVGQVIDDTVLTTEVKAKLSAEKLSNLTKIEVKTDQGIVTLNGTVPPLTYVISGFVGGETLATSGVTGAASCSTANGTAVGAFDITCVVNTLAVRLGDALSAGVPFYGAQPPAADVAKIKAHMLIQYAGNDERIDAGWPAFEAALKANKVHYEQYTYAGAQHGFNNDTTPRYDEASAKQAWTRTMDWFNKYVRASS